VFPIIKDRYGIKKDLVKEDLVNYLDNARKKKRMRTKDFKFFINYIYGKVRSSPAHGNIDIKDKINIIEIYPKYKKFHEIVDLFIEDFLDHNQRIV
jgi:hypothetical protein